MLKNNGLNFFYFSLIRKNAVTLLPHKKKTVLSPDVVIQLIEY